MRVINFFGKDNVLRELDFKIYKVYERQNVYFCYNNRFNKHNYDNEIILICVEPDKYDFKHIYKSSKETKKILTICLLTYNKSKYPEINEYINLENVNIIETKKNIFPDKSELVCKYF